MKYLPSFISTRLWSIRGAESALSRITLAIAAVCFVLPTPANSQSTGSTGYITDSFFVPIRRGPGNGFRIIKHNVTTGTRLEFLADDNPDDPWSKVRLSNGMEGFIRSQYISAEPIARTQLKRLTESVNQLTADRKALAEENQALKGQQTELQSNLSNAENKGATASQELERIRRVSAEALQLYDRHQALLERVEVMKTEMEVLKAKNSRLLRQEKERWVLLGAGLVLVGVILTILIQNRPRRKKYSEWA